MIEIAKAEGMLSGMTASVSVKIEGVDDAILIPIEALHKTSDGAYVYTSYNEEYQEYGGKVDVITGLENSTYVKIKSGLSVGDTVYSTEQQSGIGNFCGMGFDNFDSDAETKNVDIGDAHISVEIDGGKASGNLDDIKAGTFVAITMNGEGEVTNVLVSSQSSFDGGGRRPTN